MELEQNIQNNVSIEMHLCEAAQLTRGEENARTDLADAVTHPELDQVFNNHHRLILILTIDPLQTKSFSNSGLQTKSFSNSGLQTKSFSNSGSQA